MAGRKVKEKKKLLWVGDAVVQTGFARVTHSILDRLSSLYDVSVLGVNYRGDPHKYSYKIYPAMLGGDLLGFGRLAALVRGINPDIICILNDPWVIYQYSNILKQVFESNRNNVKIFFYMPVDAHNIASPFVDPMDIADVSICYTNFGVQELVKAGLKSKVAVIPHGHDSHIFYPEDKLKSRAAISNDRIGEDWFIVGNTNRNQPRKRLDLLIEYFAEFVKDKPNTVKLMYHGVMHDQGWNLIDLAKYYGILDHFFVTSLTLTMDTLPSQDILRLIYNSMDVYASTTQGEGWGLGHSESMGCCIPQIVPDFSALGEWCRDETGVPVVEYVPISYYGATPGQVNTVHGLPGKQDFVNALNKLYYDKQYRLALAERGYKHITSKQFSWDTVANMFKVLFESEF